MVRCVAEVEEMIIKVFIKCAVMILTLAAPAVPSTFWYSADGPVPLQVDSSKVTIKLEEGFTYEQALGSVDRILAVIEDDHLIDGFIACSLSTGADYDAFLDSLSTLEGIYLVEPYYLSENGYVKLVGEGLCVAFHEYVTYEDIDSINALYRVVIDRERIGRPKAFTLKNTDSSGHRVVELANIYHNLPQVEYAHPDFSAAIVKNGYMLYDHYNQYQPHLKKVIGGFNVASVWDFAGLDQTITVALIDDGIDIHEDLPSARILPGYDFVGSYPYYNPDNDPSPGDSCGHGMAMVGIIAASHTTDPAMGKFPSTGLISMNPHVNIMPIKVWDDVFCDRTQMISRLSDAIDYAWTEGADILCCGWTFENPLEPDCPEINHALERATIFGRNGLGCPVIFPSGDNPSPLQYPFVRYPARLPYCFAVGAIRLDDSLWYYSCNGPFLELDFVAPSDDGYTTPVWSLDQMGALGWNPTYFSDCLGISNDVDYNCYFGGTSAACALVSGTAALIMAKDPSFNFEGYYYILRYSAMTDLEIGSMPVVPTIDYGYGRVDAFRAILSLSHGNVDNVIGLGGPIDVADITYLVKYLYKNGPEPFPSVLLADCDCDGDVTVTDLTYLANYLFNYGPAPVKPCYAF